MEHRDFIRVGRSRIHGKGVFAKRKIRKGTRIIEYAGARVPLTNLFVVKNDGPQPPLYAMQLNDTTVIDPEREGNDSRFVNHSCEPNCETYAFDDRMYVYAKRDISRGEELTFDYRLGSPDGRIPKKRDLGDYECHCGSPACRGTMVARPTRRSSR